MLMRKLKLGMMAGVFAVSSGIASTPITMPSSAQWDSVEAVELGATAQFKVEGKWNDDLMKQVSPPGPIPPDGIPLAKAN